MWNSHLNGTKDKDLGETKMKSVEHSMSFGVPQPVSRVFPLFSPEGEKHWVPGWDYENVMDTKELSEDYVFLTKSHDHAAAEAIWLVKRYSPDVHCVEFYKVEPGDKVGIVKVCCDALADQCTQVAVTYRYIALSETGEAFVSGFTAEAYKEFITEWQRLLSDYFAANG
jgi:hypothetical protein